MIEKEKSIGVEFYLRRQNASQCSPEKPSAQNKAKCDFIPEKLDGKFSHQGDLEGEGRKSKKESRDDFSHFYKKLRPDTGNRVPAEIALPFGKFNFFYLVASTLDNHILTMRTKCIFSHMTGDISDINIV